MPGGPRKLIWLEGDASAVPCCGDTATGPETAATLAVDVLCRIAGLAW